MRKIKKLLKASELMRTLYKSLPKQKQEEFHKRYLKQLEEREKQEESAKNE